MDDNLNEDIFGELLDEEQEAPVEETGPVTYVTLVTPGGKSLTIGNITEPVTIDQLLHQGGVTIAPDTAIVVDGTAVNREFSVGPGAVVALISLQKGG